MTEGYDPSAIRYLAGMEPRRRPDAHAENVLSDDALLVIAQWKGRPDAALHMIHDVCVPAGRVADHTMIPAVEEVGEAGLTENAWEGLRLTDAGRAVLAALQGGPGGVARGMPEAGGEPGQ